MVGPNDIQAPWVGHSREEYFGYDDEPKREYDEDAEYEHYRDLQDDEMSDDNGGNKWKDIMNRYLKN